MLTVSWDTVRLFLHVLAATIWVGGQLTLARWFPCCAGSDLTHRASRPLGSRLSPGGLGPR